MEIFNYDDFHRKDLFQIYYNIPYFNIKKYCFIYKNKFLGEHAGFFSNYFQSLAITYILMIASEKSKYLRLKPFFIDKKILS